MFNKNLKCYQFLPFIVLISFFDVGVGLGGACIGLFNVLLNVPWLFMLDPCFMPVFKPNCSDFSKALILPLLLLRLTL
jgi:hypothetical protein